MTTDLCLILALLITLAIWAVCSKVPDNFGRNRTQELIGGSRDLRIVFLKNLMNNFEHY